MNIHDIKKKLAQQPRHSYSRDAAVLLPLVTIRDELHVLFQIRAFTLNAQPGETCFPGGKIDDSDQTPEAAAIREFTEELGVPESQISVLSPLTTIESPRRGFIYPFVAYIHSLDSIEPNKEEVEDWFTIPLSYLIENEPRSGFMKITVEPGDRFPIHHIANSAAYQKKTYNAQEFFYHYEDKIVWGLTGRILKSFLEQIKHE